MTSRASIEIVSSVGGLDASVGGTALLALRGIDPIPDGTTVLAKLESTNPGGSIKDRPVLRMLRSALAQGRFDGGRRLLDSSSGNAGIAYAQFGAVLGVPVTLVVPGNASRERLERIRAHGAELVLTDPLEGYDFAIREAARLARAHSDRYWYCDQYGNEENWRAHHETTGPELLADLARAGVRPEAFVCGIGTGGTLTGVGRRLREWEPAVLVAAAVPEDFPGIEGLKPLGSPHDLVPAILDESLIDERVRVRSDEAAAVCRALARRGLFVGPSSGANVLAAARLAAEHGLAAVATVLPDGGERYGSTGIWGA